MRSIMIYLSVVIIAITALFLIVVVVWNKLTRR